MPTSCAAFGCFNTNVKKCCRNAGISFHNFPHSDKSLTQQWLLNLRRKNFLPTLNTKVCSEHFEESCFEYQNFTNRRQLKKDAVPTKFCFDQLENGRKRTSSNFKNIDSVRFPTKENQRAWICAVHQKDWMPSKSGKPSLNKFHQDFIPSLLLENGKEQYAEKPAHYERYEKNSVIEEMASVSYTQEDHNSQLNKTAVSPEFPQMNSHETSKESNRNIRKFKEPGMPSKSSEEDIFLTDGMMKVASKSTASVKNYHTRKLILPIKEQDDIFGKFVACEMKALAENHPLYIQTKQDILQVLTNAIMNHTQFC